MKELNGELKALYRRMDSEQADLSFEVDSIRRELREIEESKARKMLLRSRANWALYREKCSKYFLNLEKRNYKEKTLSSLTTSNGNTVTDVQGILKIGRDFYERLYDNQEDQLIPMDDIR